MKNILNTIFRYSCLVLVICLFHSEILRSQCSGANAFNLPQFTSSTMVADLQSGDLELSGLTSVDDREFVMVSDNFTDEGFIQIVTSDGGNGTNIFNLLGSPLSCNDVEAITYLNTVPGSNPDLHRFAFSQERTREIVIITLDLSMPGMSVYPTSPDVITIDGISSSCAGNNGIEALGYDQNSDIMYFGVEPGQIYSYKLSDVENDGTVSAPLFINLNALEADDEIDFCTLAGMDVLPNGNIVLITTYSNLCNVPGADTGEFNRNLIELDPCGNLISQLDLSSISILDNRELEGIVYRSGDLYIVGEFGVLYQLTTNPNALVLTVTNPGIGETFSNGDNLLIEWVITPPFANGQVQIELYQGNMFITTLTASTANDGIFSATLPNDIIAPTGSDYRFQISHNTEGALSGFSPFFTISECLSNLTINTNAGTSDNQQASATITADNTIGVNSNAIYHAGEEVLLSDGFVAVSGSTFRAYIDGCSDTFEELQNTPKAKSN